MPKSRSSLPLSADLARWLELMAREDSTEELSSLDQLAFPTNELLAEYVDVIHERPESEILGILRQFLFPATTFGADQSNLNMHLETIGEWPEPPYPMEYWRSLLRSMSGRDPAQPGLRWILDLLPYWPEAALRVIEAYILVFGQVLPDKRLEGISDGATLIRARYVAESSGDIGTARATINNLRPREVEVLVAAVYEALGYEVRLTQLTRDGGRDVEAHIERDGMRQRVLIECKHWTGAVGVDTVRSLAGVVHDDRATSGVLISTGSISKEAQKFAARNSQLHLVDGDQFIGLLARSLGHLWPTSIDRLLSRDLAHRRTR